MRISWMALSVTGISLLTGALLRSQVAPAARQGSALLSVGVGPSSYDVDWGHGRMLGGTLWVDAHPRMPSLLDGLGMEVEARDISLNHSTSQPSNFRQDTLGGGPIYTWNHYRNFRPYGKFLVDFGSIDFSTTGPYRHDTRTVYAPGFGFQYRVYRNLWARADYEYQWWQTILGGTPDPQGFTIGVTYDVASFRSH